MDYVYASDEANARAVATSAHSLLNYNPGATVRVIAQKWQSESLMWLRRAVSGGDVDIVDVSSAVLPSGIDHISSAAYLKLLIPDILENVGRCIYLDADTLIRANLSELSPHLPEGCAVAGVRDSEVPRIGCAVGIRKWRDEGLDPHADYINTGVMVLDLDVWRREQLGQRMFRWKEHNPAGWTDNDAICAVLNGDVALLPRRFNSTIHGMRETSAVYGFEERDDVDTALSNPAIVHFTGAIKPWHSNAAMPFLDEWRTVATSLGWANFRHSFTRRRRIEQRLMRYIDSRA